MRIAVVGAGAVGGYFGALLSRAGSEVAFIARGTHLEAIRDHGLQVVGPLGDFTARVQAESDPGRIGTVDVVIVAVKTYDNADAFPLVHPLLGPETPVLTLQNGVDSAEDLARIVGRSRVLAGAAYVATAIDGPGVIRQTGTHRRIVFGECFEPEPVASTRVRALEAVMSAADIHAEAMADARPAIWEKFIYLAPFAAFTGAARLPIGPIWADSDSRSAFLHAVAEVAAVARATGIAVPDNYLQRIEDYAADLPPGTRSSLLIDLSQGKRIEVESLAGSVVRRGREVSVATPRMEALYAVLKPHAAGRDAALMTS